ncbi:MAG: hypothetical protein J1F32_01770 [Erysipelotrichales bacterium]|nr:hypothetical protein [Erysipelotrichales bacterium]
MKSKDLLKKLEKRAINSFKMYCWFRDINKVEYSIFYEGEMCVYDQLMCLLNDKEDSPTIWKRLINQYGSSCEKETFLDEKKFFLNPIYIMDMIDISVQSMLTSESLDELAHKYISLLQFIEDFYKFGVVKFHENN